jgi:hypothetical protein
VRKAALSSSTRDWEVCSAPILAVVQSPLLILVEILRELEILEEKPVDSRPSAQRGTPGPTGVSDFNSGVWVS